MAAQDSMTRSRGTGGAEPEPEMKTKPQVKRIGLKEVFDLVDDIWIYIERNESRSRLFGRMQGIHKEEFDSIRERIATARELLHPRPVVEDKPKGEQDGDTPDDRTDQ